MLSPDDLPKPIPPELSAKFADLQRIAASPMKTTDLVEMQQRMREVARPMTEALEMTVSARAIAADFTENFRNLVLPDHLHSLATLATELAGQLPR